MKAKVQIFHTHWVRDDKAILEYEIANLNLQSRKMGGELEGFCFRDRMIDDEGHYATDFEHSGASKFMVEVIMFGTPNLISEGWIDVIGVVTELRMYPEGVDPWEDAQDCDYCREHQDEHVKPHLTVPYLPPRDDEVPRSGEKYATPSIDGSSSRWYGKIARIRMFESNPDKID